MATLVGASTQSVWEGGRSAALPRLPPRLLPAVPCAPPPATCPAAATRPTPSRPPARLPGTVDVAAGTRFVSGGVIRVQRQYPGRYEAHACAPNGATQLLEEAPAEPSYQVGALGGARAEGEVPSRRRPAAVRVRCGWGPLCPKPGSEARLAHRPAALLPLHPLAAPALPGRTWTRIRRINRTRSLEVESFHCTHSLRSLHPLTRRRSWMP